MPTFSNKPDWGVPKQHESNVVVSKFGDGYEQRQAVGMNNLKQIWPLTFTNRTTSESDTIEAFLKARNGVESFDWTPPDGLVALKFKCDMASFVRIPVKYGFWTISATFKQVFEP